MSGYNRRLPIYLLVDCSESMAGEPISAVHQGIALLLTELRGNPMALETVALSVISFASTARQVTPLTDLLSFQMPKLLMGSGTVLGAALELWCQCMEGEIVKASETQKGDYKPICFILTDGEPTDDWEGIADKIRTTITGKKANIIAAIGGPDGNSKKMQRITDTVIKLKDASSGTFSVFFKWISSSISTASQRIEGAKDQPIGLPQVPQEIIASGQMDNPIPDRFAFLHSKCVENGAFYILRFAKQPDAFLNKGVYKGVAAHPVEDYEFEDEGQGKGLQIAASKLQEGSPCPYCGNVLWAKCSRGHIHCCPLYENSVVLTCPWCKVTDTYSRISFDVGSGLG